MEDLIRGFPGQLSNGYAESLKYDIPLAGRSFSHVILLGMGGSAFGAEVVRNLSFGSSTLPFLILRDYQIPAFVGKHSLVIASSYSGNTEETLEATESAAGKGATVVAITSGGKLAAMAREKGFLLLSLPQGFPPRAAAGYSIAHLLHLFFKLGLVADPQPELQASVQLISNLASNTATRELAKDMKGRMVFLYSGSEFESAAIRWRQQIEENAKHIVSHHVVPEMNHNELVGWQHPGTVLKEAAVVFLESPLDHARNRTRMQLNREIIARTGARIHNVLAEGSSRMQHLFWLIHFGDWVSLHLSRENGEDPMPVQVIDFLKNELSKT